ncbi:hypothetical protein CC80DRAFT_492288 [Byssothecium circinans]|uniref:Uncharacterized protein n=1 Tax=Byssothecium circinans TaxID=147558 RepID=A0A6A5TYT5_9PLEO|nr:hypothetical protein CC80DRAFT_492288 [Byssothecium circinans]
MTFWSYSLRSLARRPHIVRIPLRAPVLKPVRPTCSFQSRKYSSAPSDSKKPPGRTQRDENLRNLDIDEIEKRMKYLSGDHATWDHEKLKKLSYVEDLLPATIYEGFGDYAISGHRPGGGRPSFPLLTQEEFVYLDTPYNQWAPAPYNDLTYSCNDKLMPLFGTDENNELKMSSFSRFSARLRPLKAKMWIGTVPLTQERWLAKKMDDPENYHMLFELIRDILTVFAYLNYHQTLDHTRYCFNWLVDKFVEFEGAANLLREQKGIQEKLNLSGMWAEYYHDVVSTMSNRTHKWIVDRVEEVQDRAFADYNAALQKAGDDQEAIAKAGKKYYECVQDLNSAVTKVDYVLGVPMTGFKGYGSSESALDLPLQVRREAYMNMYGTKSSTHQKKILQAQDEEAKSEPPLDRISITFEERTKLLQHAGPRFRDKEAFIGHFHEGRKNRAETRLALRGKPSPLGEEHWITILKERMEFYLANGRDRKTHRWGFVWYRLTYKQTDEEWANFLAKFEAHVFKSGRWIDGWDTITDMAGLTFVDGRDFGIAEGDIGAAKEHFKSRFPMLPTLGRMWTNDFLVIDDQSYDSHMHAKSEDPSEGPLPLPFRGSYGDNGPHVRLVDTVEYPQEMLDELYPGYNGELKVLSSLVLEELYPLLATYAIRPAGLWPLARLHPQEVFVGHTVNVQEAWWEWNRIEKTSMMTAFWEHLRKKKTAMDR